MLLVSQQYSNWGIRPTTDRGTDYRDITRTVGADRYLMRSDGASAGYVRKLAAPPQPISYADT